MGRHVEQGGEHGAVMTEYVALLALVTVGMTVALAAVARSLIATHDVIQGLCGLPFP